jgi:NADH:ubiquinone reductase (H+-translocating)
MTTPHRHRVLIVGAGDAGLGVCEALKRAPVDVTLVDQHNHHTFQALLYQVATSALHAEDIGHQVRGMVRDRANVRFVMGRVVDFDLDAKEVRLEAGPALPYDTLVVAAGTSYADLGVPGVRRHAFLLKSLNDAVTLRSHILRNFEAASLHPDADRQAHVTFAIVGAGATGVEMAGALSELFKVTARDFPELRHVRPRIVVIEAAERALPTYHDRTGAYAAEVLRRRGVEVRLGTKVAGVGEDEILLDGGERIPCRTVIWTAGVRAHPLAERLGVALASGYRVPVTDRLHLAERPEVFVVGDMSGARSPQGTPYPMVAQVAIQQGKHAGKVVLARLSGRADTPFHYRDRGTMAIVAQLPDDREHRQEHAGDDEARRRRRGRR